MSETVETTQSQQSDQPSGQGEGDGNGPGQQPATPQAFTQTDVERIVKERLAQAQRKTEQQVAKAAADAEAKALAEQGKFKELYEKLQADLQDRESKLAAMERRQLAASVAGKVGLPATLADRLQGSTPEEMEADARAILEALPKPAAPNINASQGTNAPREGQMTEDRRAELAARYGVNPKYLQ